MRRLIVSFALGLAFVVPSALTHFSDAPLQEARCPSGDGLDWVLPGACEHADEAPPGVDVTEPVPTAELKERDGGGAEAYAAAQELGVPAPAQAAATSPAVTCEGDGSAGYRTQAMYVVEAGRTNRFSALQASFQLWAAGVDDVVNRSAALTGGVRHVRYVTEASGGSCVAKVLNVTVPAGSLGSFNSSIAAIQALGYTEPSRKYLMWTDATVLCGIASMYPNDSDSQGNPNNGSYAQYARVDSGCWGFGDGATQHSVEAHELLHTYGGVMSTAPHGTRAGHCWDESDTMCYADGGGFAMQQVCPAEREYLFDCNNDDYYSTYPDPGSWLDGHWNAADSRFLIGGGNGSGGGTPGAPTVLGATIAVNNPAVPGLATQASVTPALPTGRTVASVQWKSPKADCSFSTPTEVQTEVTCSATSSTATTVTATVTDSTGATKAVTSPLTFATGTARAVSIALGAAGQSPADGGTAGVCTGAAFPLNATVLDTASGRPVKGLATALTKQTATMTAPASAGSPVTGATGVATQPQTATVSTTYRGRTAAGNVYAAAGPATLVAAPATCTTSLTAELAADRVWYGDTVAVTGDVSATSGAATVVPSGVSLAVRLTTDAGKVLSLGTVKTAADGSYSFAAKPTANGTISVALTAGTSYTGGAATAGTITVDVPDTLITGAVDKTSVAYGQTVTVTGTLRRDAGGTTSPLASKSVSVYVTPAGGTAVKVGAASTKADGTFSIAVALKVSGTLSVSYAGASGQPAAKVDVGAVTAVSWSTAVTASASSSTVAAGGSVTLSGSVSRTWSGATSPAPAIKVKVTFRATGSSTTTVVSTVTTTTSGTFTAKVYPKASGTWTLTVSDVAGYVSANSSPLTITVS
jgi:5-hydroxyisourate hydrolase-like protein (transthyretin family)